MFSYTPNSEIKSGIDTNNINTMNTWWAYVYNNLRASNSNKLNDMINTITGYYGHSNTLKANSCHYPMELALRILKDPAKLAFISGASGRVSQAEYNRARDNESTLATLLGNCGFATPRRRDSAGTKNIHFIFVSSGFSLIKNYIKTTTDIEHHEFYENIINTYRKQNLTIEDIPQTLVLKNVYAPHNNISDTLTIITDRIPDLEEMLTILLFVQAHYSGALTTNQSHIELAKLAIENNDKNFPLSHKLSYYLTLFWEKELQIKRGQDNTERAAIRTLQATHLDDAFAILLKSLVAEAPTIFLQKLVERYNYDYKSKEETELKNIITNLEGHYRSIHDLEHRKHILQRKLSVLTAMNPDEVQEFWEAITLYKNITIESQSNNALILKIKSPLTFYDEEDAKTILNNPNSSAIYQIKESCEENNLTYNLVKSVLFDIFISKKYQIHTWSGFKLAISSTAHSGVLYLERYSSSGSYTSIIDNKIWQPHIMGYNCYEQAKTNFNKAIAEKNFDTAFGQLVGATQNLTISDSTVFSHLLRNLIGNYPEVPTLYNPNTQKYVSFAELYEQKEEEARALLEETETKYVTVPEMQPASEIVDAKLDF